MLLGMALRHLLLGWEQDFDIDVENLREVALFPVGRSDTASNDLAQSGLVNPGAHRNINLGAAASKDRVSKRSAKRGFHIRSETIISQ